MLNSDKYSVRKRFGRFVSKLDGSRGLYFFNIIKWKLSTLHLLFEKRENFSLPVKRELEKLSVEKDFFVLLGHGTILFNINGTKILTDPVFGDIPFYKRYTPCPYTPSDLGEIDYVLISHAHYDHLDIPSIKSLNAKHFIVPEGTYRYLEKYIPFSKITEVRWFQCIEEKGIKIHFLPAKHWSKRGMFDTNTSLWGSFLIEGRGKTFYYAGDTSYAFHFKDIGNLFKIDYAFLPVGAYKPDYIMKHNHMTPEEALKAFKDLKAKYFVPVHYGVFKLSDEPISEPLEKIENFFSNYESEIFNPIIGRIIKIR